MVLPQYLVTHGINKDYLIKDEIYEKIINIYNHVDWRVILTNDNINTTYHGIPILNFYKAFTLPYLINISSERDLWRYIYHNRSLQLLCGLFCITNKAYETTYQSFFPVEKYTFQERTLWHFRNKYKSEFSINIIKILVSIALNEDCRKIPLPFIRPLNNLSDISEKNCYEWKLDEFPFPIKIYLFGKEELSFIGEVTDKQEKWFKDWEKRLRSCTDFRLYRNLVEQREKERVEHQKNRYALFNHINFPIQIQTISKEEEDIFFELISPIWKSKKSNQPAISSALIGIEKKHEDYDKACNMIVLRTDILNKKEILLSLRKEDINEKGKYALPGGKHKLGETIEDCACRELKEETNLSIIQSRPVSLYYTRNRTQLKKQIMSIGVLVEQWGGVLKTLEPENHEGWIWFPLDNLPSPLIEFSEKAIGQFLSKKYPDLNWEDIEEKPDIQLGFNFDFNE